ncbi:MAG: type II toxin-antitoxin system RelE/ParE family toxin, partial [Armatimonadota bacterium]|nr:type II toxin-antitoxin system RelE/ParE family toxin [Armatimonadota bacterium]
NAWYERQKLRLGDDFLDAVEEVTAQICEMPEIGYAIYRNVRRILLRKFPYCVYYRVITDRVEVLAVQHTRRDPEAWMTRV